MSTTTLSKVFHGQLLTGENSYPGSGGNLNSVYAGDGYFHEMPSDEGYEVGKFPSGALPTGAESQEFRISDSDAFNSLRGIAKTKFPFEPYPSNDNPGGAPTALVDEFQQSDLAGVSSLMPGKYSYNNIQGTLSKHILDEFDADVGDGEEAEEDIDAVVELSSKEQSARSLEIRRAIEEKMEERQFHEDLDYLDLDLEDD